MNAGVMRLALEYAQSFDLPVAVHCEDLNLSRGGSMNEGITATRLGLTGIPNAAEDVMIARDLALAELTGGRLHVQHVSTRAGVEMIRAAKARGIRVTAEATPHHFTLTDAAVDSYFTNAKMNPPLRGEADRQALIEGLRDGTIDCVATDHAPHAAEEKEVPFEQAAMGVTGLETAFAALHTELVLPGTIGLDLLIERMAGGAAPFGLDRPSLAPGSEANVALCDLGAEWTVGEEGYESRSENSWCAGRKLTGRVQMTLAGGQVAYRLRSFSLGVAA
jgi:dihydroorotase